MTTSTAAVVPDAHSLRKIAVESFSCVDTVRRYFEGDRVRPVTRARIEHALSQLGIEPPKRRAS